MEEYYNRRDDLSQPATNDNLCIHCRVSPANDIGTNRFCPECRQSFINYPIPKWIWAFAAGILIVMIVGFTRMGTYMSHSIGLAKAENAIEAHKYRTAQAALKKVLVRFPDNQEAQANMLIAACYNQDVATVQEIYKKLENQQFEDQELLDRMGLALNFCGEGVGIVDSITSNQVIAAHNSGSLKDIKLLETMADTIQDPVYKRNTQFYIASFYYDLNDYVKSNQFLDSIFESAPDNYPGLSLKAAIARKNKQYDSAVSILKGMLERNREDVSVMGQLSRTELAASRNKEAAKWAKAAMDLDADNYYALEAQSMVDYFAGRKDKCLQRYDEIKAKEAKDGGDSTISTRLYKIISGQEKYQ